MRNPTGIPHREWINSVANTGLIRYRYFFNKERVFLTSPKALSEVLVTKNYEFPKSPDARMSLGQLLGFGVLVAEGDEHKHQRKNLMPAFKYHHIHDLYPIFWEKSAEMVEAVTQEIAEGKYPSTTLNGSKAAVVEFADWLSRCTLDIIGLAGMGFDFHAIQDPSEAPSW